MKLSEKRKVAIHKAVDDRFIFLRMQVCGFMERLGVGVKDKLGVELDTMIAKAAQEAAQKAVEAAEGKRPERA